MEAYGITPTQLWEASGVHRSRVSEILNGKVDPRGSTIEALLVGLEKVRPGARLYFCMLLAQEPNHSPIGVDIENLSLTELSTLYGLLSERLRAECRVIPDADLKHTGGLARKASPSTKPKKTKAKP